MPFSLPAPPGSGTTGVQLQVDTPRLFTLLTPFWYAPWRPLSPGLDAALPPVPPDPPDAEQHWLLIPQGRTDLGSVPGVLWGLIASYGRHTLSVLVHDRLSYEADQAPVAERFVRRTASDEVFHQALRDPQAGLYRAPWFRSLVMWGGVSLARYFQLKRAGFGVLMVATMGLWLAGLWVVQNAGGGPSPIAAGVLLVAGLAVLVGAGLFARRLAGLRAPTRLQAATSFMPGPSGTVGRASDVWVVRALVVVSALLLLWALWASMPWPPLWWGVPGWLAVAGLALCVLGSGYLGLVSPCRRDAALPLLTATAGPFVGLVGLVTLATLYLLWIPDACSSDGGAPVNTVDGPRQTV